MILTSKTTIGQNTIEVHQVSVSAFQIFLNGKAFGKETTQRNANTIASKLGKMFSLAT